MIEALALLLVVGLAGIGVFTVVQWRAAGRQAVQAAEDHADALAKGAQPPSLHPRINLDKCIGSGSCVTVCPEQNVLALLDGQARVVNPTSCIGHGECMRACPVDAIELVLGSERRGVDIPMVAGDFETNVPGIYVVGELGGMGLVYNAMTQALQCVEGLASKAPPAQPGVHQLVIVGAGPAGIAAGLAAKHAGLDFVMVDQESIGGTVLHYPRNKIVMTRPVTLPLYGKLHLTEVKKEDLLDIWHGILDRTGLEVRTGVQVMGIQRREADGVLDIETSEGSLAAHRVVLAMGRRGTPRKLGVPGEESAKVIYRLIEPEPYAGARCMVVGGGDSAVEAAVRLAEAGAQVDLVHRKRVFDRIKPKNQDQLDAVVEQGKITLRLESQVTQIEPDAVHLWSGETAQVLPNDHVLVSIGGVLPTGFLTNAGVSIETFRGEAYAPANR